MSEFRVEDRVQVIDVYGVIKGFDRGYAWIHYDHGGYVTAATITLSPAPPDTVTITISREDAKWMLENRYLSFDAFQQLRKALGA